ncbi:MAG TPA: aminopeptidase [Tissierellia bacterium]|nr:aminopeptidase [Tissierellia bacterium]
MNIEKNLEKYAELIVSTGLNIQPGDAVSIRFSVDGLELARKVSKKAYEKGAKNVDLKFNDDQMTLDCYLYASDEAFESVPQYQVDYAEAQFKDNTHVLALIAPNPDLLKPADPKRIADWSKVVSLANKPIQKYTLQNIVKWTIAAVPSDAWVEAVFPELPLSDGRDKLWQAVFDATRVSTDDPVAAWEAHDQALKAHESFLNEANFEKLLFEGPGTDLEVYLVENHRWMGGSSTHSGGDRFFPNIPTEEVFSMPHADKVNGTLRATMPLSVRGQLVDDFHFTFKDGKVVDFDAGVGKQILQDLLDTDEGARHLGEVALVADNSPISNTGILFKNTLFDENASCHFALGASYAENLKDSRERTEEENRALGANDSLIHVDFMVGSADVTVSGVTFDGETVVLLQDGEWQI